MKLHITKRGYLHTFALVTVILALGRCCYDHNLFAGKENVAPADSVVVLDTTETSDAEDVMSPPQEVTPKAEETPVENQEAGMAVVEDKDFKPHRIFSVPCFKDAFPDSNQVQLVAAERYGVKPVANRKDAEKRMNELVYAGACPYFHVDKLHESVPYLVPRAYNLLQAIGRAFYDSLYVKGVPLQQIIITSVLRTEEDVARLRKHNGNASENSCHRFGTTFDICYNRYIPVGTKSNPRRKVTNDTLKWVLSEVLRDQREAGRCYIKYEVKQGCFHITVR